MIGTAENIIQFLFKENSKDKQYEIKEHKERRSKNQNALLWELLMQLQNKLHIPKEEIYRHYIKEIGDYEVVPIKEEAVSKFISAWQKNGIGWVCDIDTSKLKGYTNVICYYGSSTFNTVQMTRLIDMIIEDCKIQGIETDFYMKELMKYEKVNNA